MTYEEREDAAHQEVLGIAKNIGVCFVMRDSRFDEKRSFVCIKNNRRLPSNVLYVIDDKQYEELTKDAQCMFKVNVPLDKLCWTDILTIVKANLKTTRE